MFNDEHVEVSVLEEPVQLRALVVHAGSDLIGPHGVVQPEC